MFCDICPIAQVHNDRTVPILMVILHIFPAHARNGHISNSGLKSDVTVVFIDPDFYEDAKISAIRIHLRHI